jgi:hypothetical protein
MIHAKIKSIEITEVPDLDPTILNVYLWFIATLLLIRFLKTGEPEMLKM